MIRYEGNPILKPIKDHPWESSNVFNPAAVRLGGETHIFYRAMGEDKISRIGYARSEDGYHIDERLSDPVFEPSSSLEKYGCEDPRLTALGEKCFMTYTAFGDIYQIGLTTIAVEDILKKRWEWGERLYPFPNVKNKNAVIFPRRIGNHYVMLHRIEPNICIAYSEDTRTWKDVGILMRPRANFWDDWKVGAACPPIEIDNGWLLLYNGVDTKRTYRLGVAVIDKENLENVIYRSTRPILEPICDYECNGTVPNVVFCCGATLQERQLFVYYGAADTVIGLVTFDLNKIIDTQLIKTS